MDIFFQAVDLNKEQGCDLFRLLDEDQSGTLTVEEFVCGCMRLKGPARSVDLSALMQDFQELAENWKHHESQMEPERIRTPKSVAWGDGQLQQLQQLQSPMTW